MLKQAQSHKENPNDPTVLVRGFGKMRKSQAEKLNMQYEAFNAPEVYGMKGRGAQEAAAGGDDSLSEAKWHTPKPTPIQSPQKDEYVGVAVNNYQLRFGKVHHVGEKMIHVTHRNGETVAYPHNKVFRDVEDAWPLTNKIDEAVGTLSINMKHMGKWKVDTDNVKYFDHIHKNKGKIQTLDTRPYENHLNNFGIFYTKTVKEEKEKDWGEGKDDPIENELNETYDIQFMGKHEKNGKKYSLWRKGNYHYELTHSSQGGQGYKHVTDWVNKSHEDVQKDLSANGYKKITEAVETKIQMTMPLFIRLMEWTRENCKDDVEIHKVAEALVAINGVADMDNYESLFEETSLDENVYHSVDLLEISSSLAMNYIQKAEMRNKHANNRAADIVMGKAYNKKSNGCIGNCVNSFDKSTGDTKNKKLPYRDASHFAHAEENARTISIDEFEHHHPLSDKFKKLASDPKNRLLYDKEHGVHMIHDTKRDVHHFFTKS
jgi:hypothetical protein